MGSGLPPVNGEPFLASRYAEDWIAASGGSTHIRAIAGGYSDPNFPAGRAIHLIDMRRLLRLQALHTQTLLSASQIDPPERALSLTIAQPPVDEARFEANTDAAGHVQVAELHAGPGGKSSAQ